MTVPHACQSLGAPAATARPSPAFPSVVPRTHVTALAASSQACSLGQARHRSLRCPWGRVRPPQGSAGGRPAEQGRPMHRQAGGAEARRPAGQNTQAQRARLCWSILFQSCWLLGSRFSVSSLNITKRGQRPDLLGPSWGQRHGLGHTGLPASGNGLLRALRPDGHTSWPTSCLWSGVDSTPERQKEGATVRLASREKQDTEGAGQGRRGISLKERKREGEVFTLKNREGESQ